MMNKIDLQRIEMLVRGETPAGMHEELFIVAFKSGLAGESFMLTILQVSDIFEGLTKDNNRYFCLGYALGQKVFNEANEQMTDQVSTNYNKKTTH